MATMIDQNPSIQTHLRDCATVTSILPADKDCKSCGFYPIPRKRQSVCPHAVQTTYTCPCCGYTFSYAGPVH